MKDHLLQAESAPAQAAFPAGLNNAFLFAAFNALSFQIILASPMILYAKSLAASATVLGIIAGMMPLLVIFQIPAASHINRIGYRKFVLAGWSARVAFIFLIALVPLTGGFLNPANRLALLLALLFCFNLSRGISSCAWLPWITVLVPAELRGRYLARDAAVQNLASLATFLIAAATLSGASRPWQFAALFAFSAAMGAVSLLFFALYSVLSNVTLGLAPIAWGLLIDAVGDHAPRWLGLEWNRFTVFFAAAAVAFAVTFGVARRLEEPKAASLEELLREILIQSPQRFWLRFWPRA